MKKFYVTFGNKHVSQTGRSLGGHYTEISAYDEEQARKIVSDRYGLFWSAMYQEDEFKEMEPLNLLQYESLTYPPNRPKAKRVIDRDWETIFRACSSSYALISV